MFEPSFLCCVVGSAMLCASVGAGLTSLVRICYRPVFQISLYWELEMRSDFLRCDRLISRTQHKPAMGQALLLLSPRTFAISPMSFLPHGFPLVFHPVAAYHEPPDPVVAVGLMSPMAFSPCALSNTLDA